MNDEQRADQAHDDSYHEWLLRRDEAKARREWAPDNPRPDDPGKCRCGATAEDPYCYCGC
jgi:hypothetical protein